MADIHRAQVAPQKDSIELRKCCAVLCEGLEGRLEVNPVQNLCPTVERETLHVEK